MLLKTLTAKDPLPCISHSEAAARNGVPGQETSVIFT